MLIVTMKTPKQRVSIVNFEQVNFSWVNADFDIYFVSETFLSSIFSLI